jgi:hypothetical protein
MDEQSVRDAMAEQGFDRVEELRDGARRYGWRHKDGKPSMFWPIREHAIRWAVDRTQRGGLWG